jgi:hypothetical protein
MRDEGYLPIDSRRFGPLAILRKKQWWSVEGLDPRQKIYFVFLALQAIPSAIYPRHGQVRFQLESLVVRPGCY